VSLWHPQTEAEADLHLGLWGLCLDSIAVVESHRTLADMSPAACLRVAISEEDGQRLLAEAARARAIIGTGESPFPAADLCQCDYCQLERRMAVHVARHQALDLLLLLQCQQSARAEAMARSARAYERERERAYQLQQQQQRAQEDA
jgi:hypothetical protein